MASTWVPNLVTLGPRVSELKDIRLKNEIAPACNILTPWGRHLHGTCAIPGRMYPASLGSLRPPLRKFCTSACFRKGSRGRMPSSFWCFGASNGLGSVRIRPSARPLLTKALRPPRRCVLLGMNRWCCHLARKVLTLPIGK